MSGCFGNARHDRWIQRDISRYYAECESNERATQEWEEEQERLRSENQEIEDEEKEMELKEAIYRQSMIANAANRLLNAKAMIANAEEELGTAIVSEDIANAFNQMHVAAEEAITAANLYKSILEADAEVKING